MRIKEFETILEVECQCHKDFNLDIEMLGYGTERSFRAYDRQQNSLSKFEFGIKEFPLTNDKFGMDLFNAKEGILATVIRDKDYNILDNNPYDLGFCLIDLNTSNTSYTK